jgi:DNA-binding Xre family transcriptional regulator
MEDIQKICNFLECSGNDLLSPDSPVRFVD